MKHYTPRDEAALIDAVEEQHGQFLPEECQAHEIAELAGKNAPTPPLSSGCEEVALFLVAYDPAAQVDVPTPLLENDPSPDAPAGRRRQARDEDGRTRWVTVRHEGDGSKDRTLSTVRVCANEDLLRRWPRFEGVINDPDPVR